MNKKRDMDLVRQILLEVEEGKSVFNILSKSHAKAIMVDDADCLEGADAQKLEYHLELLVGVGFIRVRDRSLSGTWYVDGLSWEGHEFLDNIRDKDTWTKTKGILAKIGGGSMEIAAAIAKSAVEAKVKELTGWG